MDLALKKIELINWLTQQDQDMIEKVENLRKSGIKNAYDERMNEDLEIKLDRSKSDVAAGRTLSQEEAETYFRSKTGK